jgi:hypothetical protein
MAYRQHAPDLVRVEFVMIRENLPQVSALRSICYVLDRSISSQMGRPSLVQQCLGPSETANSSIEPRVTASVVRHIFWAQTFYVLTRVKGWSHIVSSILELQSTYLFSKHSSSTCPSPDFCSILERRLDRWKDHWGEILSVFFRLTLD